MGQYRIGDGWSSDCGHQPSDTGDVSMSKSVKSRRSGQHVSTHVFLEEQLHGLSFHITEDMGETAIGPEASLPHRHPFYSILYVTNSDGKHYLECDVYENIKDTVFLIQPGQMHYWEDVTEIKGKLIYFGEEFLVENSHPVNAVWETELINEMIHGGQHAVMLTSCQKKNLEQLSKMMMKEYRAKEPRYAEVLRGYLNAFLVGVWRAGTQQESRKSPAQSSLNIEFQRLLSQNIKEHFSMQYYANALGLTVGRFTRQIKKQAGVTPSEQHRIAVTTEAKRLLANTNLSVSEVAEQLGFVDSAYFCRVFKKRTGLSPGQFRKQCLSRYE